VAAVSFGPTFALVRQADGDRWAWDPKAATKVKISPAGLVDIASTDDGRAAAVLEGGRLLTSLDKGTSWKDATSRVQPWPSTLQADEEGVWIGLGSGGAVRLEKDGSLSEFSSLPKKAEGKDEAKDARWTLAETPLERAFHKGVPVDGHTALVEAAGAMVRVDMRTGAILAMSRRVLPADANCESMRIGNQIVTACQGRQSRLVATSGLTGELVIEKTFQAEGRFAASGSNLLFEGPCSGAERQPGVLCIRREGTWTELDARGAFAEQDAGAQRLEVARWIPGDEQGAVGIVTRPSFGFLHARTGAFVECPKDCHAKQVDGLMTRPGDDVLDRTWVTSRDGKIRGWTREGSATIALDGTVSPSSYQWAAVRGVGEVGLAWERDGRVWQSSDRGESWKEVLGPPWQDNARDPMICSDVGCHLGPWLRYGWNADVPVALDKPFKVRPPSMVRLSPVPTLTCVGTGEVRSSTANPAQNPTVQLEAGLGARLFPRMQGTTSVFRVTYGLGPLHPVVSTDNSAFGLSAVLYAKAPNVVDGPLGPSPAAPGELENVYTWWYAEPFDAAMSVRSETLRLRQMAEAAGVFRPALLTLNSDSDRVAIPVLSSTPGKGEGMLLSLDGGIWSWVRPQRRLPIAVLTMGVEQSDPGEVMSAVATGDERVAILAVPSEGSVRVLELQPGKARMLFFLPPAGRREQYPGNADALAIDARGDLGVIRMPSGTQPATKDDPALLMHAGAAPIELAPWSTLASSDAAECVNDTSGYRAIVQTQRSWLDVRNANAPISDTRGMIAMVRWGTSRVCLEAVVVGTEPVDARQNSVPTAYVAQYAPKPVASRVGLTSGVEYRSGQNCKLVPARP
jgi:hypothetical protein